MEQQKFSDRFCPSLLIKITHGLVAVKKDVKDHYPR